MVCYKTAERLGSCLSHLHQGWRLLLMVGVLIGSQLRRIRSSFLKPFAIHLRFFQLWMMTDSVKLLIVAFYGLCILHGHLAFSFIFQSLSYYLRTSNTPPFLVPPSPSCRQSAQRAPGTWAGWSFRTKHLRARAKSCTGIITRPII